MSRPILRDLLFQEADAAGELVHAVDAVLDADPAVEAHAAQRPENRIVVIQPLANF